MITRVHKLANIRKFKVWDLEWIPGTYQLRVCGVFDPWAGYVAYDTLEDFVSHQLIPSNKGVWYYAHFGGGADLQFLLELLSSRPAFRLRGSFSGASCVIAHVGYGRFQWHFVDSFWLLRSPLRDIAKWIGREKTGPADEFTDEQRKEWYATVPIAQLKEYNANDCEVLWYAIHKAQCSILDLGGQLQMTIASTAMHLFRRKFLTEDVSTNRYINDIAQRAYFASRVEVYQRTVDYPGLYYDVNSSFPYAMTFPMPGKLRQNRQDISATVWDHYPFLADVEIDVPDCYLPPLATRLQDKVFFPTGRWRSWLTGVDLKLLLKEGGSIRKIHSCKIFEPFHDLKAYAETIYQRRAKCTDPFEREFYKLLLNSLYGKFAEQSDKMTLLINPQASELEKLDRAESMLFPGVFIKTSEVPIPHAHVPISCYIVSIARQTLYDFMAKASEIHYCDTDGFSTVDDYQVGGGLGGLKLEKSFDTADFLVPKLYRWQPTATAKDPHPAPVVKAKGFSLGKDKAKASEHFDRLVMGGEIQITRMARIRENLRARHLGPRDVTVTKRLRQIDFLQGNYRAEAMPKRFMYPDGLTRPWTYGELTKSRTGEK